MNQSGYSRIQLFISFIGVQRKTFVVFKWLLVNCFFYYVLSFSKLVKLNKIIKIAETVDWAPRKWCKIVLLRDQGYNYAEIRREIGGNLTKDGIYKFSKIYDETQSLQIKTGKSRK